MRAALIDAERRAVGNNDGAGAGGVLQHQFARAHGGGSAVSVRAGQRECAGTEFGQRAAAAGQRVGERHVLRRRIKLIRLAGHLAEPGRIIERVGHAELQRATVEHNRATNPQRAGATNILGGAGNQDAVVGQVYVAGKVTEG